MNISELVIYRNLKHEDLFEDMAGLMGLGKEGQKADPFACAGELDGEVVDLRTVIDKDCELSILTFEDEGGKAAFRHRNAQSGWYIGYRANGRTYQGSRK